MYKMPPDAPPPGLVEYLQATLPAAGAPESDRSRWGTTRAALGGASWAVWGPAMAVRATLGALREPAPPKPKKSMTSRVLRFAASSMTSALTGKPQPKPWWRRAVGWVR